MDERNIIALISGIAFLFIAFTPVVPVMLNHYGMNNIFLVKAVIGMLTLVCGWGMMWGFFKKQGEEKTKKDGKIRVKPVFLFIGVLIISLSWFTGLPSWLSNISGLETTFDFGTDTGLEGGIGTRIFTSLLTAVGVLFIKFSLRRMNSALEGERNDGMMYAKLAGDREW